jgi:hypothetical protein
MAKVSGLVTSVTVASNNISNDILSFTADTPYGVQDVTGLDKSGMERILLRGDVTGTLSGVFNTTGGMSHATLKTPGSKTFVIVYPGPATLSFTAVTSNYALSFGEDGSLTWSVEYALSSGSVGAWT